MNLVAVPGNPLTGTSTLPGDKSISHRVALFAAISSGENRIENFLVAGVTQVMLEALSELGMVWSLNGTTLQVQGAGLRRTIGAPDQIRLDCGNSGTTMRLLAGAVAALGLSVVLDGSDRLRSRPMKRIVEPLQRMGVDIQSSLDNSLRRCLGRNAEQCNLAQSVPDTVRDTKAVRLCRFIQSIGLEW